MFQEEVRIADLDVDALERRVVDVVDQDEVRVDLDSAILTEHQANVEPLLSDLVIARVRPEFEQRRLLELPFVVADTQAEKIHLLLTFLAFFDWSERHEA